MEMLNQGFDGKNYLRIQHNLDDLPQNTVNRNGSYKLSINNRSNILFPSNNNNYYDKEDNNCCFCQMSWEIKVAWLKANAQNASFPTLLRWLFNLYHLV